MWAKIILNNVNFSTYPWTLYHCTLKYFKFLLFAITCHPWIHLKHNSVKHYQDKYVSYNEFAEFPVNVWYSSKIKAVCDDNDDLVHDKDVESAANRI